MPTTEEQTVHRFSFYERVVHWLTALSFLYAALTGLALWSPRLYWIAAVFEGGETVRAWHPLGGRVLYSLSRVYVRVLGSTDAIGQGGPPLVAAGPPLCRA